MTIAGLVPILATPFDDAGGLDLKSLRRLVEFQLACRVDGVAVFGMASEGFALTSAERVRILTEVRAVAGDSLPVVAGVNATATQPALEQAKAAADAGADALMVLPPFLVKPSGAQLVDFYGAVGAGGLPVMVQDAPAATGVAMPVPLIQNLSRLDGVTSVKVEAQPTAPKVGEVVASVSPDFAVLGGQNAFFVLEEYARGAVGTMPACEFADLLRTVLDDIAASRCDDAQAGFDALLPLIRFGMQAGIAWAIHKEVLFRRGVISSVTVRSPALPLDDSSRVELDRILARLALGPA